MDDLNMQGFIIFSTAVLSIGFIWLLGWVIWRKAHGTPEEGNYK